MGTRQSAASNKDDLVVEDKCSESEASASEDPLLLRAQNEELQDQLQRIRAETQESKEREQASVQQWETCVETMKVQVKTSGEELLLAREQVDKLRQEHIVGIDAKSKEIAAARSATLEKAEVANCLAARAAQLEVEVAAAEEDATSAHARAKASTEREAKAVHQRILAESAQKTAEMAQAAAEACAAATAAGASNNSQELALALRAKAEASDAAAALQKKLHAKTEELDAKKNVGEELAAAIAGKKVAATELLTSKAQLASKTQELAAAITAKTEAVDEAAAAKVEFEAKTQELMVKMEEELTKMMEGKLEENATDASVSTPEATMLRQELLEMMKELDVVREELKTKKEATDAPPLKKVKLEPTDENAPPPTQGNGMQDEQVQLLLGEMESMQKEKKKSDKVLKDFKQLKKMTVEQFVESLSAESDVNKAAAKSKGKRPTATATSDSASLTSVKRVRAASPAPRR